LRLSAIGFIWLKGKQKNSTIQTISQHFVKITIIKGRGKKISEEGRTKREESNRSEE